MKTPPFQGTMLMSFIFNNTVCVLDDTGKLVIRAVSTREIKRRLR